MRPTTLITASLVLSAMTACSSVEPSDVKAEVSIEAMSVSLDREQNRVNGTMSVLVRNTGEKIVYVVPCPTYIERRASNGEWIAVYVPICTPVGEVALSSGSTHVYQVTFDNLLLGAGATENWRAPLSGDYRVLATLYVEGGRVDDSPRSDPFTLVLE
jgi:hypothetical protein